MSALDRLLHETNESDPILALRLLREGPKEIALTHPMFAMHVLWECIARGPELERHARGVLISNTLYRTGMQVYAGSAPPPPDTSHMSPAASLSAQWAPESIPHAFYSELAKAQRIPIPSPDSSQFYDEEAEEDETDAASSSPHTESAGA